MDEAELREAWKDKTGMPLSEKIKLTGLVLAFALSASYLVALSEKPEPSDSASIKTPVEHTIQP